MKNEIKQIKCPNCKTVINVSDILYHQLEEQVKKEYELKFTLLITEEKSRIQNQVEEKMEMKISEKDQVIETMKGQINEMQRKIEQGSMQLQGEVQELAIEDFLKTNFPMDSIEEVKKGARGADCVQIINTRSRQNCGTIVYESKRTQSFQPAWVEKFKEDMRLEGATLGVIVTEAMPRDMQHMGQMDGIWICTFQEFKGLSHVLREAVIMYSSALTSQENKGEKMAMLYEYLTGNEFRMQVEAIVEGFSQMQTDLSGEKRSMEMIWKKRERQIEKVLQNTIHMYGNIKGIAGNAIGTIKALELPAPGDNA
jgi:hypothetical protein